MNTRRNYLIMTILLLLYSSIGHSQLSLSGIVSSDQNIIISIETVTGKPILKTEIVNGKYFSTEPVNINEDIYIISFGDYKYNTLLENKPLKIEGTIKGRPRNIGEIVKEGAEKQNKVDIIKPKLIQNNFDIQYMINDNQDPMIIAAAAYEFINNISTSHEKLKLVYEQIPSSLQKSELGKFLFNKIELTQHIAIGAKAPNIEMMDKEGNSIDLSSFHGKYIVLDFWASWCGPCRLEMQKLMSIYPQIKGYDLEFISISIDTDRQKWLTANEQEKLPWISVIPSTKWAPIVAENFGFIQIPFIVFIGKEGEIIARHIRSAQIVEIVSELRNKK